MSNQLIHQNTLRTLLGASTALAMTMSVMGCGIFAEVERQELAEEQQGKDQKRMALNCQKSISQLQETYCDGAMESVPVGMSDALTQQRNGLAMNCKDPGSKAKIAELDTCLEELASNE